MSAPRVYPDIPSPPRGVVLTRWLFILLFVGLSLWVLLFLFFLSHHSNSTTIQHRHVAQESITNAGALEAIQALQHKTVAPILVSSTVKLHNLKPIHPPSLSHEFLQAAGNAPLSVYHSPPRSVTEGLTNPQNVSLQETQKTQAIKKINRPSPKSLKRVLQAGSLIPATLVTGIQSDLPGTLIARVRRDVFDTVTGNHLLIPQGSTLIGRYDAHIAFGQSRLSVVWHRLLFPHGESLNLNQMPGTDLSGLAGLQDQVNHHYTRILGSGLLFSALGAMGQLSQPQTTSLTAPQVIVGAVGQPMDQTAMQWMQKNMNIQPTIQIRPGAHFNVLVTRDLIFPSAMAF